MAAHAFSDSADNASRLAVGRVSDVAYASLLGGAPRVLKKKPVLMLDPDELAKAHLAIAMGGAQIMEDAGEPAMVARPRTPSALLGLAPVDAPEDWEPGFATIAPAEDEWDEPEEAGFAAEYTADFEDEAEDDGESIADWDLTQEAFEPEPEPAPELEALAEVEFPSIEEQLARMRHLTQRAEVPVAEPEELTASEPEFEPEPEPETELVDDDFVAVPEPEPEPVSVPEPEFHPEADVFNLSLAAAITPEPEDYAAEGPDLSWMQPKAPRQLHFSEAEQSSLRARLVQLDVEADDDFAVPSLWDRVRGWVARLFR